MIIELWLYYPFIYILPSDDMIIHCVAFSADTRAIESPHAHSAQENPAESAVLHCTSI